MADSKDPLNTVQVFFDTLDTIRGHQFMVLGMTPDGLGVACTCGMWKSPLANWSSREDHEEYHQIHLANVITLALREGHTKS